MEFPDRITVKILQHHIDLGNPRRSESCAVSMAFRELFPGAQVGTAASVMVRNRETGQSATYEARVFSDHMEFLRRFDNEGICYPQAEPTVIEYVKT